MYRVSSFTALLRGPASSSPVCCLTAPVRGAHGGAQGDGTRHKKGTKLRIKYYDIPRIPGVTYAPDSEGNLSSEAVDEFANMSELSRGKLRTTLPGPVAVNPEFFNRNPRNLEMMNLAVRQTGWNLEADRKDYYNKIVFERTLHHTRASVVHASGRVIVSASTEEFAIAKFLYRATDHSAATNIGRVLGRRMLETGIVTALCDLTEEERKGNRISTFLRALTDVGIQLQEGERIVTPNPYGGVESRRLK